MNQIEPTSFESDQMTKSTVLITSATGRIGKELVARLGADAKLNVRTLSFASAPRRATSSLPIRPVADVIRTVDFVI